MFFEETWIFLNFNQSQLSLEILSKLYFIDPSIKQYLRQFTLKLYPRKPHAHRTLQRDQVLEYQVDFKQ